MRSYEVCRQMLELEETHCLIAYEQPDEEIPVRPQTIQMWHQRLGHLNKRDIVRLQGGSKGIQIGNPPMSNTL